MSVEGGPPTESPKPRGRGLALRARPLGKIVAVLLPVAAVGAMVRVSVQQHRAPRSWFECPSALKRLIMGEWFLLGDRHRYSELVADIVAFSDIERGNRYAYFLGRSGTLEDRSAEQTVTHPGDVGIGVDTFRWHSRPVTAADLPSRFAGGKHLGLEGTCPDCTITLACAEDRKGSLDVWSISTVERTQAGATILAWEPHHEVGGPFVPAPDAIDIALLVLMLGWALSVLLNKTAVLGGSIWLYGVPALALLLAGLMFAAQLFLKFD